MKICDSSYLIAFLHPNPNPPMDRQGRPVTRFRDRIEYLIGELSASSDILGVPTPALAETLVRSGPNRAQYMKVLGDSWKFQILPFDSRAAIETAELIAEVKNNKDKWDTWAKVKFDIQIVAIAKAEGASVIYSDDNDIENYAKRFNIRVIRICDLDLPPSKNEKTTDTASVGTQSGFLFGLEPESSAKPADSLPETKQDEVSTEIVPPSPVRSGEQPTLERTGEVSTKSGLSAAQQVDVDRTHVESTVEENGTPNPKKL